MPRTRQKTISYRRAVWLGAGNLETLLNQAHDKLKKVASRKFLRDDNQVIKSIRHKQTTSGHYVHIVAETPGDLASILAVRNESKEGFDLDTAPAPPGSEYMDGDIFLLVKGNDVCLCVTGLREAGASNFLRLLFAKAGLPHTATQFELQKVANVDKAKLIHAEGVREIDIRATMFDATHKYIKRKSSGEGAMGAIGKHLTAIFESDAEERDNIEVNVVLSAKRRGLELKPQAAHAAIATGAERLRGIAEDLLEGDVDYVIVTGEGRKISPTEVYVSVRVPIEASGKTTSCDKTWEAMRAFYEDLKSNGILAE